jgi:hypothetical protein
MTKRVAKDTADWWLHLYRQDRLCLFYNKDGFEGIRWSIDRITEEEFMIRMFASGRIDKRLDELDYGDPLDLYLLKLQEDE